MFAGKGPSLNLREIDNQTIKLLNFETIKL
jgi:hypothetical protein